MKFIDLHRHLEGSVRPETIYELLQPEESFEAFRKTMQVDGTEETLMDFILKLGTKYMKKVVKNEKELKRFGYEAVEDAFNEGIVYLELRACPLPIHQAIPAISIRAYINAVRTGMLEAEEKYDIKSNLIISFKREDTETENMQLADETIQAFQQGLVCGADLCGNEPAYPTRNYRKLFSKLKTAGLPITIHAGEADTAKSIWEALELGADRIGHATNLFTDKQLMEEIKKRGVGLECCLTSNLHTRNIPSITNHPIVTYYEGNILATINTDDPITSDITYTSESELLKKTFNYSEKELRQIALNALQIAFLDSATKRELRKKI